ncbi:MAG: DNA glycosylase [Eubacteriales bacterium]
MEICFDKDRVILKDIIFSPCQTLFCGQTFRFEQLGEKITGVAHGRVITIEEKKDSIILYPVSKEDFYNIWFNYFDLNRDYEELKRAFSTDEALEEVIKYADGMRVLNQEPFETLISFIISANNNIARISRIIKEVCRRFGREIDGEHYAFPKPEELKKATEKDFYECGAGYRAPYLAKTVKSICDGFDLEGVKSMEYLEARKKLNTLFGVGNKVADCVLLYSLGFSNAFPVDVWMKRVLSKTYGVCFTDKQLLKFLEDKFGENAGIAQQYLFHYARNHRELFI